MRASSRRTRIAPKQAPMSITVRAPCTASSTAGNPGSSSRTSAPCSARATGKAATTSASPPVLTSGKISAATCSTRIGAPLGAPGAAGFNCASRSMSRVTRVMPESVRKKRAASAAASSPITMPSGMMQSRSTTAREMRAWRPTCTPGSSTLQFTEHWECTRTWENRIDRNTAPETMQPPETMDSMAIPRRSSWLCTNLAGGNCGW
jgi:hypothetical protein